MPSSRPFWLLLALTIISAVVCIPTQSISGRQSGNIIVNGVDSRDHDGKNLQYLCRLWLICMQGNPFLRLEVRDMKVNYPDQWNLYLLGLDQLHVTDQEDPLSYYGLAGRTAQLFDCDDI